MSELRPDEAMALKHFLANHSPAFAAFCQAQYDFYTSACNEAMVGDKQNIQTARQHAHFAKCYSSLMAELGNFADNQLRTAHQ